MKILFNIFLIFMLLVAFVPPFRRFMFHLLVGRQLVKEQRRQEQARQQYARREGSIRVDKNPNQNGSRFNGGDYVDYEEVK